MKNEKILKTYKVILLIETSRQFGRGLLRGVSKYSNLIGSWECYTITGGFHTPMPGYLKNWGADGIIMREPKNYKEVIAMKVPTITCFHTHSKVLIPSLPRIVTDDAAITKMGAEHLLNRGFRHFAFCGSNAYWSKERAKHFSKTIAKEGFETNIFMSSEYQLKNFWQRERQRLIDWLKLLPKPIGLMAGNDDNGRNAIAACKAAQISVPEEVAVLGVDNDQLLCELGAVPLSSIAISTEKAGYEAAQLLDGIMKGEEKPENQKIIVYPTQVVTRQSTDILAIEDQAVAAALNFIRENAKKSIDVNNVATTVTMSRRSLERRFRSVLGHSVLSEIKRVRTTLIARLLVETTQSVSQIGLSLDFSNIDHIARYFKRETGMTPKEYRAKYSSK
ncbi:DNA-binding transcriptional regulator [Planctomycetota bacterium]